MRFDFRRVPRAVVLVRGPTPGACHRPHRPVERHADVQMTLSASGWNGEAEMQLWRSSLPGNNQKYLVKVYQ